LAATNGAVMFMQNSYLVLRVEGALAMSKLLSHEKAVDLVRPNLGNVVKAFLLIMDEIDFEPLVEALRNIVDIYGEEVAPYALSLCEKLSGIFIRLTE
jgi:hypothetical protein